LTRDPYCRTGRRVLRAFVAILCVLGILCSIVPSLSAQTVPPDPRFGIVETFVNAGAANAAGAGYSRIILRWDVIQPDGPADWKPANVPDPYVAAELEAGREVVAILIGTPKWAAVRPEDGALAVPNLDAWAAFAKRMAEHYRGRVRHWIIWNEPDVWEAGHPGQTWAGSVEDYAQLLQTAYRAIKSADPSLQVHIAGLTYFWDWSHGRRQYLDRLLDILAADPDGPANGYYFDAVVYHLYFKPLQAPKVLAEARASLQKHGIKAKEVWVNETNAPPSDDKQELPWSKARYQVSLGEQAAFVLQEFSLAFAAGAARVEFYKLRNSADHPESIEPYGLLRGDDSRRPAFVAYQVMTTYLRDFRSAVREQSGPVNAVTFDRGSATTTVVWTAGSKAARVAVRAAGTEAVLVNERGETRRIKPQGGRYLIDLPGATCTNHAECIIGGAPRLIVEQAPARGRKALVARP
jgi:hypothetical protein